LNVKPVTVYNARQFMTDIRVALTMAAMYSLLAFIGFGLLGLLVATGRPRPGFPVVPLADVLGTLAVFVLIYFVAAVGAAGAVFILRPLRRSWVGWAVTGGVVAAIGYGALFGFLVRFSSVSAWFWRLKGGTPPQPGDLEFFLVLVAVIMVPMGAAAGVYWRDNPT